MAHASAREFRCRGCTLVAMIDGGPHSSTFRGDRTPGTPPCPHCGARSWIDPYSFTAYYAKLGSNAETCVVGPHEDASVRHVVFEPGEPLATPSHTVLVITKVSVGLCARHEATVQTTGIGPFRAAAEQQSP